MDFFATMLLHWTYLRWKYRQMLNSHFLNWIQFCIYHGPLCKDLKMAKKKISKHNFNRNKFVKNHCETYAVQCHCRANANQKNNKNLIEHGAVFGWKLYYCVVLESRNQTELLEEQHHHLYTQIISSGLIGLISPYYLDESFKNYRFLYQMFRMDNLSFRLAFTVVGFKLMKMILFYRFYSNDKVVFINHKVDPLLLSRTELS